MLKVVALIKRSADMSRHEFMHHWTVEHPSYVRALPGVLAYRQNPALDLDREWPWDGMAEIWFDSVSAVAAAFDGPAAQALFDHEKAFLADVVWFLASEIDVPLRD